MHPEKDEEVEPRVYDARPEIEPRQHGAGKGHGPEQAEAGVHHAAAYAEQQHQRQYARHCVGQARCEGTHPEELHAQRLHPDEERRFFPKGLKIYLHVGPLASEQHLAGSLGKVHLVPIEQLHPAQHRHEDQCRPQGNEQRDEVSVHRVRLSGAGQRQGRARWFIARAGAWAIACRSACSADAGRPSAQCNDRPQRP